MVKKPKKPVKKVKKNGNKMMMSEKEMRDKMKKGHKPMMKGY
mgnify:CR=1 FL=1